MDGDYKWWQGACQKDGGRHRGRLHDSHKLEDSHTEYPEKGDGMEKLRESRTILGVKLDDAETQRQGKQGWRKELT